MIRADCSQFVTGSLEEEKSTQEEKQNPTVMPCITVPSNYLETGGTGSAAFDFQ